MPVTLTGLPEIVVGEKRARRAAATAAGLSMAIPSTAFADTTLPSSSSRTSTVTRPSARNPLAFGGYSGMGRLMALPLRTPPETGACGAGGADDDFAGG